MSEIKHAQLPFELCNYIDAVEHTTTMCVMIPKLGKVKIPFSYKPGETDATAEFIVEACNNYYKLKVQNEKLKEALKFLHSFTPDLGSIGIDSPFAAAIQQADDTLKFCES